jgi:hypothetical protein
MNRLVEKDVEEISPRNIIKRVQCPRHAKGARILSHTREIRIFIDVVTDRQSVKERNQSRYCLEFLAYK